MALGRTARVIAAFMVANLTLVVSACATTEEDEMSPGEARDALIGTVRESAARLSLDGWTSSHAPEVGDCGARSGERVNYSFTFGVPAPDRDHEGAARAMADHWRSLGMQVRLVESPSYVVYGSGGPVEGLTFSTGPGNYYIAGTSLCVPGDADEIRKQDNG